MAATYTRGEKLRPNPATLTVWVATRRLEVGFIVAAHVATLTVMICATATGFGLDDSWILQRFARNLAETGVVGYVGGVPSSGTTSLLWPWLLAGSYRLGLDPILFTLILSGACALAASLLLRQILVADGIHAHVATLAAGSMAASGNWLWLTVSGMEVALFVALALFCIAAWQRDQIGLAAVCSGLAVGTRPEALAIACVLLALDRIRGRPIRWSLITVPLGVLIGIAIWSYTTRGVWLPVTLEGRRWLVGADVAPNYLRLMFWRDWLEQLVVGSAGATFLAENCWHVIVVSAVFGAAGGVRRRLVGTLALVGWTAAHTLAYLVVLPWSGHAGRYQPMLLALVVPFAVLGVWRMSPPIRRLAALPVALGALLSVFSWRTTAIDATAHINQAHRAAARWVGSHTSSDELIAAFDIGAIGFELPRRTIVDLGGLVDPGYLPYLRTRRACDYLAAYHVSLIVLPERAADTTIPLGSVSDRIGVVCPGGALERLAVFTAPAEIWERAWNQTENAYPQVSVYRIVQP